MLVAEVSGLRYGFLRRSLLRFALTFHNFVGIIELKSVPYGNFLADSFFILDFSYYI